MVTFTVGTSCSSDEEKPSMAEATVTKVSQTHNSVVISITGATDNVGVDKFVVKNHSDNSSVGEYSPSTNQITISDLTPSTGYNWDIYAKDAAGNVSDNCKNITFTTDALVSNYCGETLTSTDNNATVDMSCEYKNNKYIISFTNPTLNGVASVLAGFNGSFCTIGGTGAHDARDYYSVNNSEKIVLEFDGVPNFYTKLYINIPSGNERIFDWPNDVVWGTCPIVAVTGVTLNQSALEMQVGGSTQTLVATVAPTNATNKNVTWESNDTEVATVENGVVTAVGDGTATITVTTEDGSFTDECEVTVTTPSITPVTYNGYGANKGVYALYGITRDYDQSLVFSARVDAAFNFNKRVHYYKSGVADVWADLVYNSVTDTYDYTADGPFEDGEAWVVEFYFPFPNDAASIVCNYTVGSEQAEPDNISVGAVVLNKAATTLSVGGTDNLSATAYPSFATNAGAISWNSDATSYATVDAGTVTAIAAGSANITATCGGVTSSPCVVKVVDALEEAKYYGCGGFANNAGVPVSYEFAFTRATNNNVRLDVVFSRDMSGIISSNNFQMYVSGQNRNMTYDADTKTASYDFGAQDEDDPIPYYFYFVLDGGGLHQTTQVDYIVGSSNEPMKALTLGENENNAALLVDDAYFDKVIVGRTFATNKGHYTLVLPFDLDEDAVAAKLPGTLTELSDSYLKPNGDLKLNFVDVTSMTAGKAYLYLPSQAVANPVFENVTIKSALVTTDTEKADFIGIYAPMTIVDLQGISNSYVLGADNYLYESSQVSTTGGDMKALRAYFTLDFQEQMIQGRRTRAMVVFNEPRTDMPTDVEAVEEIAAPAKRIENGQLIIEKNGRLYNAQGQVIR